MDFIFVKYIGKVDASIVVICCSTFQCQAQVAELPHTVIFYDNALRMILLFQLDHLFRSKIRLFLDGFHDRLAAL